MASVALEFALPAIPGIAKVKVYESPTKDGTYVSIDETTAVGTYPDYINSYTTANASSEDDWFAISYVDSGGAESELSQPWQGGTQSVVSQIVSRVIQRGTGLSETVVIQTAEAVAEMYFGVDPYTVPLPVPYRVLEGLTYLVMAAGIQTEASQSSSTQSFTAGLVSMKTQDSTEISKSIDSLLDLARQFLGLTKSRIAQMIPPEVAGGTATMITTDISRLVMVEIVP